MSGYDNPVTPSRGGKLDFSWVIDSLALSAQYVWWDTMITRPEAGRFSPKLERSGKIWLFTFVNPLFHNLLGLYMIGLYKLCPLYHWMEHTINWPHSSDSDVKDNYSLSGSL